MVPKLNGGTRLGRLDTLLRKLKPATKVFTGREARAQAVQRMTARLERVGHPRVQMALLVSATGSAGFFLDRLMLGAGLGRMSVRYSLAVVLAYGVFLGLIKVWLVFHCRKKARSASSGSSWDLDVVSGGGGGGSGGGGSSMSFRGGGGSSGGGGASLAFADEGAAPAIVPVPVQSGSGGGSKLFSFGRAGGGGGGGGGLDGDEVLCVLAVLVAVLGAFLAAGYLVSQAPAIFGDVLVDGSLSAGLYKRLKTLEAHSWLETALKKTVLPFAVVALLLGAAGHFAQKAAPEARSIGGVWHHIVG
jgi:hypothetical protein